MTTAVAEPPRLRERIRGGATDFAILALCVGTIAGIVKIAWRGFTFWGDNAESFFPLWHMYGTALRNGEFFLFDKDGWGAGNVVGEAAYGLFNPVTALNAIFISLSDEISFTGFLVIVEFLVLLAWGVYMLARSYGATRWASFVAGIIAPFAGYTMFYEAGNWASGLMSIVWVVHFWWAARAFAHARLGPIIPVLFGFLAVTVGNPYSVVGILITLIAVGLELLVVRNFRRFGGLVLVGIAIGTGVILTYLPLMFALQQIDRPVSGDLVGNINYLTPSLSDLLALSAPSFLPRMEAWLTYHDLVPSTYLSWVILPLLAWVRWRALGRWRVNASLLIAALLYLMLTLGPDRLWLFRWPIRFVEYFFVAILVIFALLVSRGLADDRIVRRVAFSVLAVAVGLYLSFSSMPALSSIHVLLAVTVAGLVAVALVLNRRAGKIGLVLAVVLGTAVVAPVQGVLFGWTNQHVAEGVDQPPPDDLRVVREAAAALSGRVLQIAELERLIGTDAVASGRLTFGNVGAAAGVDILNRYTGINFEKFKDGMAFDYRGTVGDWFALSQLWSPVSDDIPVAVIDALGVDTLVVAADRRDVGDLADVANRWHIVEEDDVRVVLQRDQPIEHPALHALDGATITDAVEDGNDLTFRVSAPEGGRILVDRLNWVGYTATLDGERVSLETAPYGLLLMDIPAGADGTVHLTYSVPGLTLSAILLGGGLVLTVVYELVWWTRRGRREPVATVDVGDEDELEYRI